MFLLIRGYDAGKYDRLIVEMVLHATGNQCLKGSLLLLYRYPLIILNCQPINQAQSTIQVGKSDEGGV